MVLLSANWQHMVMERGGVPWEQPRVYMAGFQPRRAHQQSSGVAGAAPWAVQWGAVFRAASFQARARTRLFCFEGRKKRILPSSILLLFMVMLTGSPISDPKNKEECIWLIFMVKEPQLYSSHQALACCYLGFSSLVMSPIGPRQQI